MSNSEHSSDVWSVDETEAGLSDEYSSHIFVLPQEKRLVNRPLEYFDVE